MRATLAVMGAMYGPRSGGPAGSEVPEATERITVERLGALILGNI